MVFFFNSIDGWNFGSFRVYFVGDGDILGTICTDEDGNQISKKLNASFPSCLHHQRSRLIGSLIAISLRLQRSLLLFVLIVTRMLGTETRAFPPFNKELFTSSLSNCKPKLRT